MVLAHVEVDKAYTQLERDSKYKPLRSKKCEVRLGWNGILRHGNEQERDCILM